MFLIAKLTRMKSTLETNSIKEMALADIIILFIFNLHWNIFILQRYFRMNFGFKINF